jgi:hypothetical protein
MKIYTGIFASGSTMDIWIACHSENAYSRVVDCQDPHSFRGPQFEQHVYRLRCYKSKKMENAT